jgi:transcriptional regulator with XRE-family HTH domain
MIMETNDLNEDIGKRIKDLRQRNGLTQQELADRAELTKGFISQLERGLVSPSVETLMGMIAILGSTPADFFKDEETQIVFSEEDYSEKTDENGNSRKWLVPGAQRYQMEPLLVVIAPHQTLEEDRPHEGEEFGYCISGTVEVHFGDESFCVKAGESFYYPATKLHRISNPAAGPAKLIWISTPPSF